MVQTQNIYSIYDKYYFYESAKARIDNGEPVEKERYCTVKACTTHKIDPASQLTTSCLAIKLF